MSDSSTRCRQCGEKYAEISLHWAKSSDCDFPELTDRQHQILQGVLLSRGSVEHSSGNNPSVRITADDTDVLGFIDDEFGPLSNGYTLVQTAEEVKEELKERGWDVADPDPIYRLGLRSNPDFNSYHAKWYDHPGPDAAADAEREKRIPGSLTPTPLLLKTWYATKGTLRPKDDRKRVVFGATNLNAPDGFFERFLDEFNPRHYTDSSSGTEDLVLRDTEAFFEYIGDPDGSFKRFADKWPTDDDTLLADSESGETCPSCKRTYTYLSAHWSNESADCDFPVLTSEQEAVFRGLFLGGAYLNQTGETKRPHLLLESTSAPFIDWVADHLGILVSSVSERGNDAESLRDWVGEDKDVETFDPIQRLQTRSHPRFEAWSDWAPTRDNLDGISQLPPEVDASPMVLRALYLYRGTHMQTGGQAITRIRAERAAATPDVLCELLADFNPEAREYEWGKAVRITDNDAFFEYIGDPPAGCEDRWPTNHTDDEPTVPSTLMAPKSDVVCDQCGTSYENISQHWLMSNECSRPPLKSRHHTITRGLLLARGNLDVGGKNPSLRVDATRTELLSWLDDQFGVFSRGVTQVKTAEEVREEWEQRSDRAKNGDYSPLYLWASRSHPDLWRYEDWYVETEDGRTKQAPGSLEPSPLMLKTWYLACGALSEQEGHPYVRVGVTDAPLSDDEFSELFAAFNPRIRRHTDGTRRLVLRDSASFFEYIGEAPSDDFAGKWPNADETPLADTKQGSECPNCGLQFKHLSSHWAGADCEYPALSETQVAVLQALVVSGVTINRTGDGKQPHILLDSTNEAFLSWIATQLDWLHSSLNVRATSEEATAEGHARLNPDSEGEWDAVYRLQTRSHPYIEETLEPLQEAVTATDDPSDLDIEYTHPMFLKTVYGRRGGLVSVSGDRRPLIRCTNIRASPEFIAAVFGVFDPTVHRRERAKGFPAVSIRHADSFIEYLGNPPNGCEDQWPTPTN